MSNIQKIALRGEEEDQGRGEQTITLRGKRKTRDEENRISPCGGRGRPGTRRTEEMIQERGGRGEEMWSHKKKKKEKSSEEID